jgi:hypothetical protein
LFSTGAEKVLTNQLIQWRKISRVFFEKKKFREIFIPRKRSRHPGWWSGDNDYPGVKGSWKSVKQLALKIDLPNDGALSQSFQMVPSFM